MSQFGFFDADRRLSVLSLKGDPLVEILALVPWEKFRTDIETVVLTAAGSKKSPAGRKPIDALVLFRMLVLQSLYRAPRRMRPSMTVSPWMPTSCGFGAVSSAPAAPFGPLDGQAGG